jgi:hypothetical protein
MCTSEALVTVVPDVACTSPVMVSAFPLTAFTPRSLTPSRAPSLAQIKEDSETESQAGDSRTHESVAGAEVEDGYEVQSHSTSSWVGRGTHAHQEMSEPCQRSPPQICKEDSDRPGEKDTAVCVSELELGAAPSSSRSV